MDSYASFKSVVDGKIGDILRKRHNRDCGGGVFFAHAPEHGRARHCFTNFEHRAGNGEFSRHVQSLQARQGSQKFRGAQGVPAKSNIKSLKSHKKGVTHFYGKIILAYEFLKSKLDDFRSVTVVPMEPEMLPLSALPCSEIKVSLFWVFKVATKFLEILSRIQNSHTFDVTFLIFCR